MFKKLKQKIESESEGEQSPVSRNEGPKRRSKEVRSILITLLHNNEAFVIFH